MPEADGLSELDRQPSEVASPEGITFKLARRVAVGSGDENVSLTPAQFTERMATRFYRKDRTR